MGDDDDRVLPGLIEAGWEVDVGCDLPVHVTVCELDVLDLWHELFPPKDCGGRSSVQTGVFDVCGRENR